MTAGQIDIQIPAIEKELNSLLKQPENKKQLKACLFTLIIYVHEKRLINYFGELVDTILDKFPCRIIFIHGDKESTTSYLHATVSHVKSGKGEGGALIACDQISINASKDLLYRVPYLVIPHIVPDLPVYLLWGQNPFEEKDVFPFLKPYATRVIFDSECAISLSNFCQEMEKNLNVLKMDIMDINWGIVSNWRDILFQLFDSPEKSAELHNIVAVNIIYSENESEHRLHPEIRSVYLQGWLASQLKWQYQSAKKHQNNVSLNYLSNGNPVRVTLIPQILTDLPSGSVAIVEITMSDGKTYYLARKSRLAQVVVHISSTETCELPFTLPLPNVHRGLTFMNEIFFGTLGKHYNQMMKAIAQIDYKIFNR